MWRNQNIIAVLNFNPLPSSVSSEGKKDALPEFFSLLHCLIKMITGSMTILFGPANDINGNMIV